MESDKIIEMMKSALEERKKRKEYIIANVDKFKLPELEYVKDEDLPGMFWNIFAIPVDSDPVNKHAGEEHKPYVRLEWGWDAGLTKEQLENRAEDSPTGKSFVYTDISSIRELRDNLTSILDKYDK